ncbi:hypothetical protein WDU94_009000 [Cyamophila willieti]
MGLAGGDSWINLSQVDENSCDWSVEKDRTIMADQDKVLTKIASCLSFKFNLAGMKTIQTKNALFYYLKNKDIEGLLAFLETCEHVHISRENVAHLLKCDLFDINDLKLK